MSAADDLSHDGSSPQVAHWLTTVGPTDADRVARPAVRGAFLVAPPDPIAPTFPVDLLPTFTNLRAMPLPVPGVLIAGDNDPYCAVDGATCLATDWDVPLITTGNHGHLNSDSDLGHWPQDQDLLTSFLAGLRGDWSRLLPTE